MGRVNAAHLLGQCGGQLVEAGAVVVANTSFWRMHADGSAQEQVTFNDFNNWFPHISPDGKWLAFLVLCVCLAISALYELVEWWAALIGGEGDDIFVKVIDIDLERRRISLSLKQANDAAGQGEEFDPTLYGMSATYDEQGNYIYPEGFDPETGEWLESLDAVIVAGPTLSPLTRPVLEGLPPLTGYGWNLAGSIAGVVAFRQLPIAALPQVEYPTIVVSTLLPGASAETIASAVAAWFNTVWYMTWRSPASSPSPDRWRRRSARGSAAMPSTAATKGLGARLISEMALWRYSRICLKISPGPRGTSRASGER